MKFLIWIWTFPQSLIGFILTKVTKATVKGRIVDGKVIDYYVARRFNKSWSGVSLGNYIVFANDWHIDELALRHEYGHQKQSLILGWLYLLIIGLPSLCGNLWDRIAHKNWSHWKREYWYYRQPWEHWADLLGHSKRD